MEGEDRLLVVEEDFLNGFVRSTRLESALSGEVPEGIEWVTKVGMPWPICFVFSGADEASSI